MSRILYLKVEQSIQVNNPDVKIGDVAKIECTDRSVVNRLKTEKFIELDSTPYHQKVISVLWLIKKIHDIYPDLEVQNVGETDFILSLRPAEQKKMLVALKVLGVSIVSFFGSVFAMMTFNEDVSSLEVFKKVYTWTMGEVPTKTTVLELTYSLGVGIGIIMFFNHFGKRRLTQEPSPVEVEMSGYDKQVYTTVIQHAGRKGQEKDVD